MRNSNDEKLKFSVKISNLLLICLEDFESLAKQKETRFIFFSGTFLVFLQGFPSISGFSAARLFCFRSRERVAMMEKDLVCVASEVSHSFAVIGRTRSQWRANLVRKFQCASDGSGTAFGIVSQQVTTTMSLPCSQCLSVAAITLEAMNDGFPMATVGPFPRGLERWFTARCEVSRCQFAAQLLLVRSFAVVSIWFALVIAPVTVAKNILLSLKRRIGSSLHR